MAVVTDFVHQARQTLRHPMSRDAGLLTASQCVSIGFGILTTAVAARILGPAEYGIAALIMAYPALVFSFAGVKSVSVTTRYIAGFRAAGRNEELRSICKLGYGLDLLVSVVAFFLIALTSWWVTSSILHLPEYAWLMIAYSASFPLFSLTGTSRAVLSSWQQFHRVASLEILEKGVTFVVVLGLLIFGFGVPGMVLGIAIGHTAIGLTMVALTTRLLYRDGIGAWWKGPLGPIASLRGELASFFGWNYLQVTLIGVIAHVPLILLGRLRGPEEAGFYRLAMSINTVGSYPEASLRRVAYPVLSARWGAGEEGNPDLMLKRWTLRGGLPLGLLLLITIPFFPIVIPLIFGAGYRPMVFGAQIMMIGTAVSAVFFWLNVFCYAFGKIGLWTKAYGFYTVLVIGLAWSCIQVWGFNGVAGLVGVGKGLFTVCMVGLLVSPVKRLR